jgi:hypothetical protein
MTVEIKIATVGIISASKRYSGYYLSAEDSLCPIQHNYLTDPLISPAEPFRRHIAQGTAQKRYNHCGDNLTCENVAKRIVTP